jgi:putative nucleotidyltransferase with HDIG domain
MITVQEILKEIEFLPAFNQTAQKALLLIKQDNYSVKELTDIIKFDAALTANILKVSNSAYYAKSKEIHDIGMALSFLGKDQLSSLLTLITSKEYFKNMMDGYEINQGELWEHNLSVAILAESLAHYEKAIDKSVLFTAGLLHDIGKIILNVWIKKEWEKINHLVEHEGLDFLSAEKKVLGFTHAQVGGAVLKQWNFPNEIINAAKHHHDELLYDDPVVRIICLADYLSFTMGIMTQMDNMKMKGYTNILNYYNIKTREVEALISDNLEKVQHIISEFKF